MLSFNTNSVNFMNENIMNIGVSILPDGRLDAKNAAVYCGLSVKTLAMKRCEGNGPKFVKLGRVFYYREDLDAWLRAARVTSTTQTNARAS